MCRTYIISRHGHPFYIPSTALRCAFSKVLRQQKLDHQDPDVTAIIGQREQPPARGPSIFPARSTDLRWACRLVMAGQGYSRTINGVSEAGMSVLPGAGPRCQSSWSGRTWNQGRVAAQLAPGKEREQERNLRHYSASHAIFAA